MLTSVTKFSVDADIEKQSVDNKELNFSEREEVLVFDVKNLSC